MKQQKIISTANTPYSVLLQRTSVDTAKLAGLALPFVMSIYNFCIYSFVRLEQMQQFPKSEYLDNG